MNCRSLRVREVLTQILVPVSLAIALGCGGNCGPRVSPFTSYHQTLNATRSNTISVGYTNSRDDAPTLAAAPGRFTELQRKDVRFHVLSVDGGPKQLFEVGPNQSYFSVFFEDPSGTPSTRYRLASVPTIPFAQGGTISVAHCDPLIPKDLDVYTVPKGTAIGSKTPRLPVSFDNSAVFNDRFYQYRDSGSYDVIVTARGSTTPITQLSITVEAFSSYVLILYQQGGVSKKPVFIRFGDALGGAL